MIVITQQQIEEMFERVRRIETRLCTLMEHLGMQPQNKSTLDDDKKSLTISLREGA